MIRYLFSVVAVMLPGYLGRMDQSSEAFRESRLSNWHLIIAVPR